MPRSFSMLVLSAAALAGTVAARGAAGESANPFVASSSAGWSAQDRETWYWSTQGSRMMPLAWFMALEQADSTGMLADEDNLTGFGYIPAPAGRASRLPIGFAVDQQNDEKLSVTQLRWYAGQKGGERSEPWIGMNCSACHTGQVSYQGRPIRVDGAPGMGDFDAFIAAVDAALAATLTDPAKFDRFAPRVFAASQAQDTPGNRAALRSAMSSLLAWERRATALNRSPVRAGAFRVDAFGHIYNKVVLFAGAPDPIVNPADAPVSYPFLWDIGRQKKVQWNGAATNQQIKILGKELIDIGALGRNSGEVIGVFGETNIVPASTGLKQLIGFPSSLNVLGLDKLERIVGRLRSPAWPALLPPIDPAKAAAGKALYAQHCASCHKTPDMLARNQPIEVMVSFREMGPTNLTDIWMACNSWSYDAKTGKLEGTRKNFLKGDRIGPRAPVVELLTATVQGSLIGKKHPITSVIFASRERPAPVAAGAGGGGAAAARSKEERRQACMAGSDPLLAYKARPLDGIWATAPYLHNGSVPTLYDLLLPPAQRPKSFRLGTREFDPVKVGYAPLANGGFLFETSGPDGRPADGNGNQGHDYGVGSLTDAQRWALVEYMKTL